MIRDVKDAQIYDEKVEEQVKEVQATSKIKCVDDLLRSGETWEIEYISTMTINDYKFFNV